MFTSLPKFLLCALIWLLGVTCAWSADDYKAWITDIQGRLDTTAQLYQQQQKDAARREVQMAYFEVFENLEGPIRINTSAQKSYQMESQFGEIRQMISDGKPLSDVQGKIETLKGELADVLPILTGGKPLVATAQNSVYGNDKIALYWQQKFKVIDDFLANAVTQYQQGQYDAASQSVQQAFFQGFKNSEMEMSVRNNRSSQQAADINQQFSALITLATQPDQMTAMAYADTTLLQNIEDLLPGLPTTRPDQPVTAPVPAAAGSAAASAGADAAPDANWRQVSDDINSAVAAAIAQYRAGQGKEGMMAIQDAYFDHFEASGMENKIGSRDTAFKTALEGYFTRLVSLMKAGAPLDQVQQQADALGQNLSKAVDMLGAGQESHWGLFIYSLLIIVREGLEALLIVTAIIAYLVKNKHQDKLPMINQSVWVALLASLVTAGLFQWMFANSGANRELLEGGTMMVAVVTLFFMSYWLLSKVEARHWKAYLEGKLSLSLTSGSLAGLWFTSFLAVYREGAETVLFYYALIGDSAGVAGHMSILAGFLVGCVVLLLVYVLMRYTVVKLPLKPFFMFTGGFMYLMAFVFAGQGVLELIEGKLFEPTLLKNMPQISLLGIYPYLETLAPQAVLVLAALFALWVMRRRSRTEIPGHEAV
ncbi:FTR1 family iron permease [Sodalis ligni]|jgi:high-affinity iron transporter|uniref:High-affinity iron transporter n=1 Tax=Sodalis ligni TaxID=2697027 RepID=A0A4R1NRZ2_9GAMM|nr:FTR1 family protein [Sodalis ligni]TCL07220.1 high-affinity iron transporter [Sodalis ligni]